MPRLELRPAALRVVRAVRRRLARGDEGFMLIETLIAVTLITVVMGAIGVEYVAGLVETNRGRNQTTAVQLASNTMESLRSLNASDVVVGRGKQAVASEYDTLATYSNAATLLGAKSMAVYDKAVAETSGTDATVPTDANPAQVIGNVSYNVWQYLECSAAPVDGACTSTLGSVAATKVRNLRAIVVVTWKQSVCPQGTCSYATSTLINPDPDPTFDLNQPLPPVPVVGDAGPFSVAIGDTISTQLTTTAANPGVAPLTWAQTGSLPAGLPDMTTGGLISGTVGGGPSTGATGTVTTGVVATDAFQRPSTSKSLSWTVKPALKVNTVANQANLVGDSVSLPVTATGGSGLAANYTYTATGLPDGVSISTDGKITGTPNAPGPGAAPKRNNVVVTVTDNETCSICTSPRRATLPFTWTINYPPLAVTVPQDQTWTVGTTLSAASTGNGQVQLGSRGGDGSYSWSATGLPAGVTMSAAGLVSGNPSSTTPASGTASVTATDSTASTDATSPQYSQTITFNWQTVAKPTINTPGAQRSSIGAPVNLSLASTCANAPCSYSLASGPTGLSVDSTGKITGTVGGTAATLSQVKVTVTDAAGAQVSTNAFTWTVVAAPAVSGWSAQRVTETEVYNLPLGYTCPYLSCTVTLTGNQIPGLGLKTAQRVAGDNSAAKTLTVTAATGTVYLTGTVSTTAVSAGTTADYAAGISITSADNSVNSYSTTMTAAVVPTIAGLAAKKVSETANVSNPVAYTCYTASAGTPCTITLGGTVPDGLGLSSSATVVDNNATRTITVTTPTGTVYIAGTVQTTAVPDGSTTKAFAPSLTIAPDAFYTSAAISATWTAYVPVTVAAPADQRNYIGASVSFSLTTTCAASPCVYTSPNLPAGLTISASGLVSGTIGSTATSNSAVVIVATDAGGASASTAPFTWTIDTPPSITGLTANRTLTVGGVYSNASAVSLAYTCPRANCTITLGGSPVPGLGLSADRSAVGNQGGRSLPNLTGSGTVYIVGEVQAGAVTSGSSTAWSPTISITDGGNFTTGPTSATWTAYKAPTVTAPGDRNVSVGGVESTALAYTCPAAARVSCVVNLASTVPGVGLSASPSQASSNTVLTATAGATTGTVYLTGMVQSGALGGNASKAWTPSLTITDGGAYTSPAVSGTWTAYPPPTLGSLASPRSLTEGAADGVSVSYTCPDSSCSIQLANSVPGLGLATASTTTSNSSTSLNITNASGTVWVTGLVSATAVASGASSQVYSPALTIKDGTNGTGNFTSPASSATWTAYAPPSINTGPATRTVTVGAVDSSAYTYTCPRPTCTLTLTNPVPGLGLSTSAGTSTNNTTTTLQVTASGNGTVYVAGTVQTGAASSGSTRTYSVGLQISDGGSVSSGPSSATWTAYGSKPTITGLGALAARRNQISFQQLNYTCPTQNCALSVNGPAWVYLGNSTSDVFKSTTLTSSSGVIYVGGQPGAGDTGGTVSLTMTDGSSYTVTPVPSANWTVS